MTKGILLSETVDYSEFAQMAGLSVVSIRQYATNEHTRDTFPKPVTGPDVRSPRWARRDAEAWIEGREKASTAAPKAKRGRPLKSTRTARYRFDEAATKHLRAKLEEGNVSLRDVARMLDISEAAVYMRNVGRSSWSESELTAIANKLGITPAELAPSAFGH